MKKSIKKVAYRLTAFLMVTTISSSVAGCGEPKKDEGRESVKISVWTDERKTALVTEVLDKFKDEHKDEADIEFIVSEEGEDTCKETVLSNPKGAADIFAFADDQLDELKDAGALMEIDADLGDALKDFGGVDSVAAEAVLRDGKMYAYPETAGNGYFLYYNKKYYTKDDVKTLENIVDIAKKNNKIFTMDFSSGWYLYSFFKGAGLELGISDDGKHNVCNWNTTDGQYAGSDVAKAMYTIASGAGFKSLSDDDFVKGVESKEVIAGINGAWNAKKVEKAWGDDYAATKLPTYRLTGDDIQMASFMGFKVVGINAHTENAAWCKKIVEYFTNEQNQLKEFEDIGETPANINAASSEKVKASPAVAALAEQAEFASVQRILDPYWEASSKFGISLASGNRDKRDLQNLLDKMVKEVTKKVK